jgi:CrcB protein
VPVRSELTLIALGGALGAAARYELLETFPVHPGHLPWTTGGINVGGAFLLGILMAWLARHRTVEHWSRWLVGVGGLGAFTTLSALAVEVALLARDDHALLAVGYAATSLVAGLGAVFLGLVAAGWRRAPVPSEGES